MTANPTTTPPAPARPGREWLFRLILLSGSLIFSLLAAELILTLFFPLYGGRDNVTAQGERVRGWFPPGTVYRQISNEYDATTTITAQGHRVPGVDGSPDVIFLGDSFTYGYGLNDQETFASIYCETTRRACANLGVPGSGTARQLARLQKFLQDWQWKPREVKLFFFGMSSSFSAGNDFADNYGRRPQPQERDPDDALPADEPRAGLVGRMIGAQAVLLDHSNLVRRAKYHWGPMLKTLFIDDFGDTRLTRALERTKEALDEFDALSRSAGFDYQIYLIVPVQDITRGSYAQTLAALNSVSPKPVIETAPLFVDSPERYYYFYDGHLNPAGARRIAEFLVEADGR